MGPAVILAAGPLTFHLLREQLPQRLTSRTFYIHGASLGLLKAIPHAFVDLGRQRHVAHLFRQLNPALRVGGIVLTMTDFRANLAREVANEVKQFFKELVFDTSIPRNIRLAESPSFGKPICLYDPTSTGALAYQLLTQEVINKEMVAS